MPLYEYQCDACGNRFEKIRKFSDPPVAECPACGGAVRKLVSSPAFQFKGTGWYATDYAKPGGGKDAGAEAGNDSKPESTKNDKTPAGSKESSPEKPASAKTAPAKPAAE